MRPITTTLGPNATAGATTPPIRLDEWADPPLGVQVSVTGTVNFTVQGSFDEGPDSLVNPIPVASMAWDSGLMPAGAIGGTAGLSFSIATAPLWIRVMMNSGAGSIRAVFTQYNVTEV